jgi:hypothetical protein
MAHAPTEKTWLKITRDDRAKSQSGHARPGRGRIGQPCRNWGGHFSLDKILPLPNFKA